MILERGALMKWNQCLPQTCCQGPRSRGWNKKVEPKQQAAVWMRWKIGIASLRAYMWPHYLLHMIASASSDFSHASPGLQEWMFPHFPASRSAHLLGSQYFLHLQGCSGQWSLLHLPSLWIAPCAFPSTTTRYSPSIFLNTTSLFSCFLFKKKLIEV